MGWLPLAVLYLTYTNFGSEWVDLLVAWQVLEVLFMKQVTDQGLIGCYYIKTIIGTYPLECNSGKHPYLYLYLAAVTPENGLATFA
ncbi:hypothetical protein IW262DRAFT_1469158 [Armillaria fumosa]|nr:hypothetical protein IW262DRAFT_1469158 [Armillaria fumosa]